MSIARPFLCAFALAAVPFTAGAADEMTGKYTLKLEGSARAVAGKAERLGLRIDPQKGYEVHKEPPVRMTVTAGAGIVPAQAAFTNKDLKLDGAAASIEVPFTAQTKGKWDVDAAIKFYLCNDKACTPTEGKVSVKVAVQ